MVEAAAPLTLPFAKREGKKKRSCSKLGRTTSLFGETPAAHSDPLEAAWLPH